MPSLTTLYTLVCVGLFNMLDELGLPLLLGLLQDICLVALGELGQPSLSFSTSFLSFSFSFKIVASQEPVRSSQEEEKGISRNSTHEVEASTIATIEVSFEDGLMLGTCSLCMCSS